MCAGYSYQFICPERFPEFHKNVDTSLNSRALRAPGHGLFFSRQLHFLSPLNLPFLIMLTKGQSRLLVKIFRHKSPAWIAFNPLFQETK
jgi:hypothetical protein